MTKRRTVLVTASGLAAGAALAGCGSAEATARWNSPGSGAGGAAGSEPPADAAVADADITITPTTGAKDVSPAAGVVVTASAGTLQTVSVLSGGKAVVGSLDSDQKTWRSTGRLSFGATYTVSATVTGVTGGPATKTATFTTVKPAKLVSTTLQANALTALKSGSTYGIGQPLIVNFSKAPADKTAAVKALDVQVEPEVEVRWRWVDANTVHGRPEKYWTPGTKITLSANLYGVDLGKGMYGKTSNAASITIGPAHVAIADSKTHYMKVYVDGKLVKNMPCSMGKGGYTHGSKGQLIDFWTRSGVHVLLTKEATHRMTSASYGVADTSNPNYYDEIVHLCCRISYSGEFTHSAPWSVGSQGHSNVSHGCINLSPANAKWIYDNFRLGDIVEVKNTPKQLPIWDGLGDWNTPWSKW
jgi:lipoprotein-anchoring transpeptidase ErfK/SrfK